MTVSKLGELVEADAARTANVQEARAKVDKLRTEHSRLTHLRRRLELRHAPEAEINVVTGQIEAALRELRRARRHLMRSI